MASSEEEQDEQFYRDTEKFAFQKSTTASSLSLSS